MLPRTSGVFILMLNELFMLRIIFHETADINFGVRSRNDWHHKYQRVAYTRKRAHHITSLWKFYSNWRIINLKFLIVVLIFLISLLLCGKYTALKVLDRQFMLIYYLYDYPRGEVEKEGRRRRGEEEAGGKGDGEEET